MQGGDRDELIEAQKQVIGILFEAVKRYQRNSDLDSEYFELVSGNGADRARMDAILSERQENSEAISRLLSQLEP